MADSPISAVEWDRIRTLLDVVIACNSVGPNANNISVAARQELFAINEALPNAPAPTTGVRK